MARFIMSHRRAGKFTAPEKNASRAALNDAFHTQFAESVSVIADRTPQTGQGRRTIIFDAEPTEIRAKLFSLPSDVLLEPQIVHFPAWTYPLSVNCLRAPSGGWTYPLGIAPSGLDEVPLTRSSGWSYPLNTLADVPWTYPLDDNSGWTYPLNDDPGWTYPLGNDPSGMRSPLAVPMRAPFYSKVPLGKGRRLRVRLVCKKRNLDGISLQLILRGNDGVTAAVKAETDAEGSAVFIHSSFWQPSILVIASPGSHWSWIARGPVNGQVIDIPELPAKGGVAWWHKALGIHRVDLKLGAGINVGIIDTGVSDHPHLRHVNRLGAFVGHQFDPSGGGDVAGHGSHVCGIIGSRPGRDSGYVGIAPGCTLFSVRVFPPDLGASQGDIADAIDKLSKSSKADLINLSLGSPVPSAILRDAIQDAQERGTLCLCAAGNQGAGALAFPAQFPESVAVAAVGLEGWGPSGSMSSMNYPVQVEKYGADGYFLTAFSNYSDTLDCCAPGNGIISTVPPRPDAPAPYGVMDGTSMAVPAACAALASLLSADKDYQSLPRDITRAQRARDILHSHCKELRLNPRYQGHGLPQAM